MPLLLITIVARSRAPRLPSPVVAPARALVTFCVKVRDIVSVAEGVLTWAHAAYGTSASASASARCASCAAACSAASTLIVRGATLLALCAPAAGLVEAGRRAVKGAPTSAEARGGAASRGAGGCVRRFSVVLVRVAVEIHVVPVVFGALRGRRQGRVGFADAHEAPRGCAPGRGFVEIWVVRFGEVVEGPGWVGGVC